MLGEMQPGQEHPHDKAGDPTHITLHNMA